MLRALRVRPELAVAHFLCRKQFKHWSKQVSRIHYSQSVGLLHFKYVGLEFIWLDPILHYTNRETLAYKRISSAITPLMSLQSGAINLSLLEKDLLRLSSSRKKRNNIPLDHYLGPISITFLFMAIHLSGEWSKRKRMKK